MNKPEPKAEPETDSEHESKPVEATKKGGKTTATKSPKAKAKSEPEAEAEPVVTKKKKGKATTKSPKTNSEADSEPVAATKKKGKSPRTQAEAEGSKQGIIIKHFKQCNSPKQQLQHTQQAI
ncbi:hypothetical protein LIER_04302 [Lithospermum erythrorhizon]|uniref:Uncharacterized protein n=1 Tax=Lithospermum erythrorhizon TaxID=34254 RepID=A0AAV3NZ12_LITER